MARAQGERRPQARARQARKEASCFVPLPYPWCRAALVVFLPSQCSRIESSSVEKPCSRLQMWRPRHQQFYLGFFHAEKTSFDKMNDPTSNSQLEIRSNVTTFIAIATQAMEAAPKSAASNADASAVPGTITM